MKTRGPARSPALLLLIPPAVVVLIVLWGVMDSTGGVSARTMWSVTWRDDTGTQLGGFLVTPPQARRVVSRPATGTAAPALPSRDGRYPAVLLLHQWWGLNKEISYLAEQLASDGYVVLVPDLFRGRAAVSVPGALFQTLTVRQERIDRDLDRALQVLRDVPEADPERISVVGFRFGAAQAAYLATRADRISATVLFYPPSLPTDLGTIGSEDARGPVLGIFAGRDRRISGEQISAFEQALRSRDISVEIRAYPQESADFVNSASIRLGGAAGEAWDRLRQFLRNNV